MRSRLAIHKDSFEEEQNVSLCSTSSTTSSSSSPYSPLSKGLSSSPLSPPSSPMEYNSTNSWCKTWCALPLILLLDLLCSLVFLKYETVLDPGFAAKVLNAEEKLHRQDNNIATIHKNLEDEVQSVIIGTEIAFNISQNLLPQAVMTNPSEETSQSNLRANSNESKEKLNLKKFRIPDSEWYVDLEAVDAAVQSEDGCIVYSFGIGKEDLYTNYMAEKGCHVYAFDPTQTHPRYWKPNIEFFSWGIRNSEGTPNVGWSHPKYGHLVGSLYSLPEIVTKLGHEKMAIAALKFDCEGCEYGAFQDIVDFEQTSGQRFNRIGSLSTEFHFATSLGMETLQDVANIKYADAFLRSQDCRVIHYKPNKGFKKDRMVHAHLVKNGVPDGVCCYEYGFSCN